ncbi:hypothetical protein MTO96_015166 [Rhipicephalus appendiculatus]
MNERWQIKKRSRHGHSINLVGPADTIVVPTMKVFTAATIYIFTVLAFSTSDISEVTLVLALLFVWALDMVTKALSAATEDEKVLRVILRPPLFGTRPSAGDLDLESFTQLLLSYGMQLTKEAVLTRRDARATVRHSNVQLLHVVERRV